MNPQAHHGPSSGQSVSVPVKRTVPWETDRPLWARQKGEGRHPAEAVVGPFLVVDAQPLTRQGLQVGNRFEEMGIEHLRAIGAVEALDVGVLVRLPRLDVVAGDAVLGAPVCKGLRRKLRSVIDPYRAGRPCTATRSRSTRTTRRLGSDGPIGILRPSRMPCRTPWGSGCRSTRGAPPPPVLIHASMRTAGLYGSCAKDSLR